MHQRGIKISLCSLYINSIKLYYKLILSEVLEDVQDRY